LLVPENQDPTVLQPLQLIATSPTSGIGQGLGMQKAAATRYHKLSKFVCFPNKKIPPR